MLRRHAQRGMKVAEVGESEDLKATTYHYWQREISRRDEESSSSPGVESSVPTLTAVQVIDDRDGTTAVEVVAKNGYVIRVGEQATAEHVHRVLQAVSELD